MDEMNKLLTLSNGRKFVVVNHCIYEKVDYYLVNEIINNDNSENYKIFTITKDENGHKKIKNITDQSVIKAVTDILEKKL